MAALLLEFDVIALCSFVTTNFKKIWFILTLVG